MKKLIIALFLSLPLLATAQTPQNGTNKSDLQKQKFEQFYNYLTTMYVDTLDTPELVEIAINSMLSELDPHSSYSSVDEMKAIKESFEGKFSGIGVEFDVINDTIIVVNTISGGPSESIGVMPNDRIISVNGTNAVGMDRADVPKLLRGKKGTTVEIRIKRQGIDKPMGFRITRDDIPIHTIDAAYLVEPGVGYIRVNRFAETTMKEFKEAFKKLGKLNSVIVDLRGNGGGLMDQAIEMSEFFLPYGSLILSTEGRAVKNTGYTARKSGDFVVGKVIVLIDSASASSSEIVAGAIQDWDRGLIIGQPSFGKGLVQRQFTLVDGSATRVTVARYHTPSGRVIQRPFKQGDKEGYYMDHIKRTLDKKYVDSLNASAPIYKTLRTGRKVYSGGGINPDIFIPIDTTQNYSYWNNLMQRGIVNEYLNRYLEKERARLTTRYPTFETFAASFEVTPEMIKELTELGAQRGVEYTEAQSIKSLPLIQTHIKAIIAQKLWSRNEYYRIINRSEDKAFRKAVEAIRNWNTYSKLLE